MKRQLLILLTTGMLSIASWAQVLTANQTTYHTLVGVKRPIWWRLCTTGSADNCTQPADKTVNLSVTAGSCTLSTASTTADFAEFTAPATAGTCTISAQAAAGGSAATINVTAYTGRQGHRIAPFYTVLYKGQTTVLQSILYGYALPGCSGPMSRLRAAGRPLLTAERTTGADTRQLRAVLEAPQPTITASRATKHKESRPRMSPRLLHVGKGRTF
jgi:hypothetical protein